MDFGNDANYVNVNLRRTMEEFGEKCNKSARIMIIWKNWMKSKNGLF